MGRSRAKKQSALPLRAASRPPSAWLPAAVLVALALLAYVPAMRGGYFWDDDTFLYANKLIHAPDGLRRFWLTTEATDYFPLTSTLLWFEWRLWGNHPAGYHVVNVLFHAACAVLVWRVLRRLIPQGGTGAWLAGALFALHPVAAASAAWITELKNTLSLSLFLAAVLLYLRFDETESALCSENTTVSRKDAKTQRTTRLRVTQLRLFSCLHVSQRDMKDCNPDSAICTLHSALCNRLYVFSLFLFLLALLAKTSVVMLPLVLLLCAWWRRGRISRKDLLRALPFFALSLALGLVTIWFQHYNSIKGMLIRPESVASRVAASGWIAWFYLFKDILPAGLCVIYPRWAVPGSRLLAFLPLVLLLAGMALLWTRRKSWGRAPLFAVACFLVMLLPVLGFGDMSLMQFSLVADHLQYAAMICVVAFAAGMLARACLEPGRRASAQAWRARFAVLASAACAVVLGILTWQRASLYGDAQSLWQDNVHKNPAAWAAWNGLGWISYRSGNHEKALQCFDQGVQWSPDNPSPYINRASALGQLGRYSEALDDCNAAIRLDPTAAVAYLNRSATLIGMGRCRIAVADCDRAIALVPDYADAYSNRALAHFQLKDYEKAVADVKKCLELGGRPNPSLLKGLGEALHRRE